MAGIIGSLLPIEKQLLKKTKTHGSKEFAVFYVSGNATTTETIQLRELDKPNKDSLLTYYEGYNYLKSLEIINSKIRIVIGDTMRIGNSLDTFYVKIE